MYDYSNGNNTYWRGLGGYYWESKIYSDTNARLLRFYSTDLYPQAAYNKGYGFSIRCVVQP